MKFIDVSTPKHKNLYAVVDDEDFHLVSGFKWSAEKKKNVIYAARGEWSGGVQKTVRMHQQIMGTSGNGRSLHVDHVDGNGLNNTRLNLRIASQTQNTWNTPKRRGETSKYKGVSRHSQNNSWTAYIKFKGAHINLGSFDSEEIAASAYNYAARRMHGDFANLNDIKEVTIDAIEKHRKKKPGRNQRGMDALLQEFSE